ncbi:hypothetical protein FBU30_001082 [Linnemannia zychae]|nr:hypothetical protein FBU30_001082 [Linnemannia zychae]
MNYIARPTDAMPSKAEYFEDNEGLFDDDVNNSIDTNEEVKNSPIEAVRLVVPITDDIHLVAITFRYWILSTLFGIIGAVVQQYYFYRTTSGIFSMFFVNLASYALGVAMARYFPTTTLSLGKRYSLSLNPGPFNIKEHALIGISVSAAANAAYAIDILSATDLYLNYRINAVGSLLLILTTQCIGYGMAGVLRKYLVYPAEMVWWNNLVQVVFYNAIHNTDEFKARKMIRNWSYMKFFWVVCGAMFLYEFIPHFVSLAGCVSHIVCFHGASIVSSWKRAVNADDDDIHTIMMRIYPEVPQTWYAAFYLAMTVLAIFVCEMYIKQLPWWGLLIALALGWILTLPICAMNAITGFGPGLNVVTELVCGYILPGKPIANMTFKCYGYMAMYQCMNLLSDLKLGHYMKIPPRSMFIGQFWGTVVGSFFNYMTMILIIDSQRDILNGSRADPNGLWTGQRVETFWGSGLIYGALGPSRMFIPSGRYGFVYYGFLVGAIVPVILWALSKKIPWFPWSSINISLIAGGWWQKYAFILASALDTGAAFTGLVIFLFLGGGISNKMRVDVPSWWFNHYTPEGNNAPYLNADRCGAYNGQWTGGSGL